MNTDIFKSGTNVSLAFLTPPQIVACSDSSTLCKCCGNHAPDTLPPPTHKLRLTRNGDTASSTKYTSVPKSIPCGKDTPWLQARPSPASNSRSVLDQYKLVFGVTDMSCANLVLLNEPLQRSLDAIRYKNHLDFFHGHTCTPPTSRYRCHGYIIAQVHILEDVTYLHIP